MRHLFLVASLIFLSMLVYGQKSKAKSENYNKYIKIPSTWIVKLRHYKYKQNNAAILKEFDSFLKPDSLFVPDYAKGIDKSKGGVLNPMFTDLDSEPGDELVSLFGWDSNYPSMGVFKEINNSWYLLYLRPFYMFYSEPELTVANSYSKSKIFYYREVYDRGSGVYSDGYSFYKLINNKVCPCLTLINEANISGWALTLNQEVTMNLKINGTNTDEIWALYKYEFWGSLSTANCDKCTPDYVSLIKGKNGMNYKWDNKQMLYKAEESRYDSPDMLSSKKIACFGDFGNDSLFVRAFNYEIKQTLKTGSRKQKAIMKQYLNQLKIKKTATTM